MQTGGGGEDEYKKAAERATMTEVSDIEEEGEAMAAALSTHRMGYDLRSRINQNTL